MSACLQTLEASRLKMSLLQDWGTREFNNGVNNQPDPTAYQGYVRFINNVDTCYKRLVYLECMRRSVSNLSPQIHNGIDGTTCNLYKIARDIIDVINSGQKPDWKAWTDHLENQVGRSLR